MEHFEKASRTQTKLSEVRAAIADRDKRIADGAKDLAAVMSAEEPDHKKADATQRDLESLQRERERLEIQNRALEARIPEAELEDARHLAELCRDELHRLAPEQQKRIAAFEKTLANLRAELEQIRTVGSIADVIAESLYAIRTGFAIDLGRIDVPRLDVKQLENLANHASEPAWGYANGSAATSRAHAIRAVIEKRRRRNLPANSKRSVAARVA